MWRQKIYLKLFTLVPLVFGGVAVLSSVVSFGLTSRSLKMGADPTNSIVIWSLLVGLLAGICQWFIVRYLLRPSRGFFIKAQNIPALAEESKQALNSPEDGLENYTRAFNQVTTLLSTVDVRQLFPDIIGESRTMRALLHQVVQVAPTDSTVLILGPSGTGKELIATAIHQHSKRHQNLLVKINCAAIPESLLESELFGHEKGAFTGAIGTKKGKFEIANGGTLFLDEIGDMALTTQTKLLRVLQEREFQRVGGTQTHRLNVRFIAATNQDIVRLVKEGRFRDDLFFRLNVFSLEIPSLIERREDIPLLVQHFLKSSSNLITISGSALQALMGYHWPGNVRELMNVIERAKVLCGEPAIIELNHLPAVVYDQFINSAPVLSGSRAVLPDGNIDKHLAEIEKTMIIEALKHSGGLQVKAAAMLGIQQRSLWHRIKKYNIDAREIKSSKNVV